MTTESLSQSDIDHLLGGPKTGVGGRASVDLEPLHYDFRRPHRISKERLRTIEAMHERMVKNIESYLMSRLRGQLDARLQRVEQLSFGEFTKVLPTPCTSYVMDINGEGGLQGVIDFGLDFAYVLVDRLFGGGGSATVLGRALTALEQGAIRIVADRVADIVRNVWQEFMPLSLNIVGFEASPEILKACAKDDAVLVAHIEINVNNVSSNILICLPFAALEEYFANSEVRRVSTTVRSDEELRTQRRNAEQSLRETRVSVAARLPDFRITMQQLAELRAGSVIDTGIAVDALISVTVAGQPRLVASAGRASGRLAAVIADGRLSESRAIASISPIAMLPQ